MSDAEALSVGVEDMRLRPGAQLTMRSADQALAQTRHPVEFIGALRGKSLLFTLSASGGQEVWMPIGHEYVFHVIEGMYVYAFTSRVLLLCQRPSPYVHFAWPAQVSARQVRQAYRVRLREPVLYTLNAGDENRALLLDLSMTGCQLQAPAQALSMDDRIAIRLSLDLEEADRHLKLAAVVRSITPCGVDGQAHFGLQFENLPQEDALLLHYYIDHAIASRLG